MMKERYDHGEKLFPENVIRNMMFQVNTHRINFSVQVFNSKYLLGIARVGVYAQTWLLPP